MSETFAFVRKADTVFIQRKNEKMRSFFQSTHSFDRSSNIYGREAVSVADGKMKTGIEKEKTVQLTTSPFAVQLLCNDCPEEEQRLQPKDDGHGSREEFVPDIVIDELSSNGKTLDHPTKSFMDSRFGYDFNNVRIHTGSIAAKSAESINAQAYTAGNHIVFNQSQYSPSTDGGKKLLAHELTHVVQQSGRSYEKQNNKRSLLADITLQHKPAIARQCTSDSQGNLWYKSKDEGKKRLQALIENGTCTDETCHVEKFDPAGEIKAGFRVMVCAGKKKKEKGKGAKPKASGRACLTFDDGPEKGTEEVLNELKAAGVNATFFLTGKNMDTRKESGDQKRLVLRMINEGHAVGNHTYSHSIATKSEYRKSYKTLLSNKTDSAEEIASFNKELDRNEEHFSKLLGEDFPGFSLGRLPGDGRFFSPLTSRVEGMGMKHVGWQFEMATDGVFKWVPARDWQGIKGVDGSTADLPAAGNVILFHDRHWAGANQAKLGSVISVLKKNSFSFGLLNSEGQCG